MEQAKLLGMTAILTVLIWASADSLVSEAVSVRIALDPVPTAADMLVRPASAGEMFDLTISGPRTVIEEIRGQTPLTFRLPVPDRPTGPSNLSLDRSMLKQELSEQLTAFRKLTIVSIQPASFPVVVDHWVTREADVVVRRLTLPVDVPPQVTPTTVTVRMRESVLATFPADQSLQIDIGAEIESAVAGLKDQPAGQSITFPVALDARPFGSGATVTPAAVQVTTTVQARRLTAQISTVPILVAVSFANLDKSYRAVTRDDTPLSLVTQTITVTGPTESVTRLERGTERAYGVIHLKQSDLDQLGVLRLMTPDYYLPRGVTLAEPAAPIEFKLVEAGQ